MSLLRQLYGLTPTEARIAELLSAGRSLEEISATLQVGLGTVRIHLKHVFQKTGAARQGQLVSLLNRIVPKVVD